MTDLERVTRMAKECGAHINREWSSTAIITFSKKELLAFERAVLAEAEAKLKAVDEQEPEGYKFIVWDGRKRIEVLAIDYIPQYDAVYGWEEIRDKSPLYASPKPSPDLQKLTEELKAENAELTKKLASKQAEIDQLMLEYCPDEMTQEQMEEWALAQRPTDLIP